MAFSAARWAFGIMVVVVAAVLLDSTAGVDGASFKCGKAKVNEAYDLQVNKLVDNLQQAAPQSTSRSATDRVGPVKGKASCGPKAQDPSDCASCLSSAVVDLAADCKGRESGSSTGYLRRCKMSFKRA